MPHATFRPALHVSHFALYCPCMTSPQRFPKGLDPKPEHKRKRTRVRLDGDEDMSQTEPAPPLRESSFMLPPKPVEAKPANIESGIRLRPMFDPSVKHRNEARAAIMALEDVDFDEEGMDWEVRLQMTKLINFIAESEFPEDLVKQTARANDLMLEFLPNSYQDGSKEIPPIDRGNIKKIIWKAERIINDKK